MQVSGYGKDCAIELVRNDEVAEVICSGMGEACPIPIRFDIGLILRTTWEVM
jgi:hypothetical protein